MKDYKKGSHTVWDCKYHLVWITKYRYPVLVGSEPGTVGHRARELLREIAMSLELTIYAGAINREHAREELRALPFGIATSARADGVPLPERHQERRHP